MQVQGQAQAAMSGGQGRDLCLLSLDGGGVRGLSSLLILKKLMESIDPDEPPKPCKYFDMICGTSTGGLIALMLGRLKMSIDDCIEQYRQISPEIFIKKNHRFDRHGRTQGRFDTEAFELGIKKMLSRCKIDEEQLLKEISPDCKVFICATSETHSGTVIFSNYYSDRRGSQLRNIAKIWEVARATSAAPTFFDPITIGGEIFGDGATGANNPVGNLWEEAIDIFAPSESTTAWRLEDNIQCLVSIGTGQLHFTRFGTSIVKGEVVDALLAIATDTENKANGFEKLHTDLFQNKHAFRFNVEQGLEEVSMEESAKLDYIEAVTRKYIESEKAYQTLKACSSQLKSRGWLSDIVPSMQNCNEQANKGLHHTRVCKDLFDSCSHTLAYQDWISGGRILLYSEPVSDEDLSAPINRDEVASLVVKEHYAAASLASGITKNCHKINNIVPDVYYFHGFAEFPILETSPREVLRSLVLQVFSKIVDDESLPAYILHDKFTTWEHRTIALLSGTCLDVNQKQLGDLLKTLLKLRAKPWIIAIDRHDDIAGNGSREFWDNLIDLLSNNIPNRILLSGKDNLMFGDHCKKIFSKMEYEECLWGLHEIVKVNSRRDEITIAEDDTVDWIWDHQSYKEWDKKHSALLWIQGKPGSGKSVLAKSISNDYKSRGYAGSKSSPRLVVSDWYYSIRGGTVSQKHGHLVQRLVLDFLRHDSKFFQYFAPEYRKVRPLSASWLHQNKLKMVLEIISRSSIPFLSIVDAMDESEEAPPGNLGRDMVLRTFIRAISEFPRSRMKFIMLSRPSIDIEDVFRSYDPVQSACYGITMQRETSNAINNIIGRGIKSLRSEIQNFATKNYWTDDLWTPSHHVPLNPPSSESEEMSYERIHTYLTQNAEGVILWVTLIIEALLGLVAYGIDDLNVLEKELQSLPQDLDLLYERIAHDLTAHQKDLVFTSARMKLIWVTGGNHFSTLSLGALYEALRIPSYANRSPGTNIDSILGDQIQFRDWDAFRRRLRVQCGPFVEVTPYVYRGLKDSTKIGNHYSPLDRVQLLHRTARDFLTISDKGGPLSFNADDAVAKVRSDVLEYASMIRSESARVAQAHKRGNPSVENRMEALEEALDFLERRTLLTPFLKSAVFDNFKDIRETFSALIWPGLRPPITLVSHDGLFELYRRYGFFTWLSFSSIQINQRPSWIDVSVVVLAEMVYLACTKGYRNGVKILLEVYKGKEESAQRILMVAALLAAVEAGFTNLCRHHTMLQAIYELQELDLLPRDIPELKHDAERSNLTRPSDIQRDLNWSNTKSKAVKVRSRVCSITTAAFNFVWRIFHPVISTPIQFLKRISLLSMSPHDCSNQLPDDSCPEAFKPWNLLECDCHSSPFSPRWGPGLDVNQLYSASRRSIGKRQGDTNAQRAHSNTNTVPKYQVGQAFEVVADWVYICMLG